MGLFGKDNKKRPEESPSAELLTFEEELTRLMNKYSLEALSNTPDFILAYYLKDCLIAFNSVQQRRKEYFAQREEQKNERLSQIAPLTK